MYVIKNIGPATFNIKYVFLFELDETINWRTSPSLFYMYIQIHS